MRKTVINIMINIYNDCKVIISTITIIKITIATWDGGTFQAAVKACYLHFMGIGPSQQAVRQVLNSYN